MQPFANTLVTLDLTGAQLKQALEQQWRPAGSSRPVLRLGIARASPTSTTPPPQPAPTSPGSPSMGRGQGDRCFRVVANSFLAAGGDNFAAIGQGKNKVDSGKVDLQSMVDYFAANTPATPDLAQRSVGIDLSAPDADGYSPGDPLTIDLSSLDFTTNEIKSGTVAVRSEAWAWGRSRSARPRSRTGTRPDGPVSSRPSRLACSAPRTSS